MPFSSSSNLVALLPPLWALLLLAGTGIDVVRRRWPSRIRLKEGVDDKRPQQKPLFAVFVDDEDIMATQGVATTIGDGETSAEYTGEHTLPPPPSALLFIPLLEAVAWLVVVFASLDQRFSFSVVSVGTAVAWVRSLPAFSAIVSMLRLAFLQLYAFFAQLRRRRSRTAPLALLSLYAVHLLDTGFSLVQQARQARHADTVSIFSLLRVVDIFLIAYLISTVLQMPLSIPAVATSGDKVCLPHPPLSRISRPTLPPAEPTTTIS
jgi:hypothetical protein